MNRLKYIVLGLLAALTLLCSATTTEARISLNINETAPVVHDEAGLFSEYEKVSIIDMANELSKQTGYVYIIITANELIDYIAGHELEGVYNDHRNELAGNGTVLFLINTGNKEMPCELQSYKSAIETFSHEMCEYINTEAVASAKNGSYFEAVSIIFDRLNAAAGGTLTDEQISENANGGGKNHSKLMAAVPYLAICLCIAFIIAALVMYILYTKSKASYKKMFAEKDEPTASDNIKKYKMYVRSAESTFSGK